MCQRVQDVVAIHSFGVADEHHRRTPIVNLADVVHILDVDEVAEYTEVTEGRMNWIVY
jgi:hypothetical protein